MSFHMEHLSTLLHSIRSSCSAHYKKSLIGVLLNYGDSHFKLFICVAEFILKHIYCTYLKIKFEKFESVINEPILSFFFMYWNS